MVKYYVPKSLEDALTVLRSGEYLPYAGGTDINSAGIRDRNLLFIGKLPELREIRFDGQYIRIGAAVTYSEAEKNGMIPGIMKTAIRKVAGPAIRNVGTFGGNLANGSGKADSALIDIVLDAKLLIRSAEKERILDAGSFYRGRKQVDLQPDELICEILIPKRDYYNNYYYDKISTRTSIAISNLSLAAVWCIENSIIKELAIGIGSASEYPMRCTDIEKLLLGKSLEEVENQRDTVLAEYIAELDLPLDRPGVKYRKQVCYRLLNYLLYEEFTPIRFDD